METPFPIVAAERVDGSAIVTFAAGKSALYSARLLYETFSQAEDLTDAEP
jgi:hypothetical protein